MDMQELQFSLSLLAEFLVEIVRNADKAQQQKNPELSDENRIRAYIA